MWPFSKKNNRYDALRKVVGMAPARADDCAEMVTYVVMFELHRPEVAGECNNLPMDKREIFMMTYATYLTWLTMKGVESYFPPNSWPIIESLIRREFLKQQWYRPDMMARLLNAMIESPPTGGPGLHMGLSVGPWTDAVIAASLVGDSLIDHITMEFDIFVSLISKKVLESIGKMAPNR